MASASTGYQLGDYVLVNTPPAESIPPSIIKCDWKNPAHHGKWQMDQTVYRVSNPLPPSSPPTTNLIRRYYCRLLNATGDTWVNADDIVLRVPELHTLFAPPKNTTPENDISGLYSSSSRRLKPGRIETAE